MKETAPGFEQILNATLRMLRTTWKVDHCVFLQVDDQGALSVRAFDGVAGSPWSSLVLNPTRGLARECLEKNKVIETLSVSPKDELAAILKTGAADGGKFALVPVSGQARVLGMLILGPFPKKEAVAPREGELRSAGALCAVLSAHWRLYEWMSNYLPSVNHELRTPLTAVQGSIGMVLGGMFGQVGGEVREMLEMAHKGCERTVRAIEDYLNTQNLPKE